MRGNYAPDTFTESDVISALERNGLRHKNGGRYILSQCPTHDDDHPSVQIYKDDWFVNCHAGCGRFHITKAFPELRSTSFSRGDTQKSPQRKNKSDRAVSVKYTKVDLTEFWQTLPLIPDDHEFKNIPIEVLNDLGWRWDKLNNRYFIPYFSASRTSIPFGQWRNLTPGVNRFNFWKDAKPTCYGTWNLENEKIFIVEGASDAAVLEHCSVPWLALPSANSTELIRSMSKYCHENGIQLIYAGDNDKAGNMLRDALDEAGYGFRVKQPRQPYKDWGDMYEAEGIESVQEYCFAELFPGQATMAGLIKSGDASVVEITDELFLTPVEHIQSVFPGAVELEVIKEDSPSSSKEREGESDVLF